jgi:hypothetical protein
MKILVLIIVSILTITNVFAQSGAMTIVNAANDAVDSTKKAVKDGATFIDTSSNFKTIYTDIKTNIGALASALKVGAEHVYYVLVKQQVVNSIVWLIVAIIVGISFWGMIKYSKWCRVNKIDEYNLGLAFGWLITAIAIVIVIFHIDVIVTGFVNPEYGAIMDIINFVK